MHVVVLMCSAERGTFSLASGSVDGRQHFFRNPCAQHGFFKADGRGQLGAHDQTIDVRFGKQLGIVLKAK